MPTNSKEYGRQWRSNNRQKTRSYRILAKYGLTQEQYQSLLKRQSFRCKACDISLKSVPATEIHVDHCHKSKAIRAILCGPCNRALGLMKDDAKRLHKLAKYAAKFN